jgi:hypothetical protein
MSNDHVALSERISSFYSSLSSAAVGLNAVSDELGKSVIDIDTALKNLNLGITTWVKIRSWSADDFQGDTSYWKEEIGYTKLKGRWGICLRRTDGDYSIPERDEVESWPFNEAPRALRLDAIDKIPDLLQALSKEAAETTAQIQAKLADAQVVAASILPPRVPRARTLNGGTK